MNKSIFYTIFLLLRKVLKDPEKEFGFSLCLLIRTLGLKITHLTAFPAAVSSSVAAAAAA